jgi:hypothetical protein
MGIAFQTFLDIESIFCIYLFSHMFSNPIPGNLRQGGGYHEVEKKYRIMGGSGFPLLG